MSKTISYLVAFMTGAVIAIMVVFNTEFGKLTSSEVSLIINQIVGIITLSLIMLVFKKSPAVNPQKKEARWYNYFGGLFGVFIISFNYLTVTGTNATIAMAGAVFGQSLMGLVFDMTGFMGVKKERPDKKRYISLFISLLGIIMLFISKEHFNALYLIPAVAAGILTMIQMVYNSHLASLKGAFYSARVNVISGLFGSLLYSFIFFSESTAKGFSHLSSTPFYVIVMGGLLACVVVVNTNIVIPKIPAVFSALLLSAGQLIAAVLIDYFLYGIFTLNQLIGALVILIGIAMGNIRSQKG